MGTEDLSAPAKSIPTPLDAVLDGRTFSVKARRYAFTSNTRMRNTHGSLGLRITLLVASRPALDLLPCAKHLFVAARTVWVRQETTTLRGFRPSAAAVYVGFGSSADQSRQARYVCLSPISGHQPTRRACPLCAKSDQRTAAKHPLFDHLVSAGEQHRWHFEAECLSSLEIDDQFVVRRCLHW